MKTNAKYLPPLHKVKVLDQMPEHQMYQHYSFLTEQA